MEYLSFAILYALLSGRAFLMDIDSPYPLNNLFDGPKIDWEFNKHPSFIQANIFFQASQDLKYRTKGVDYENVNYNFKITYLLFK